MSQSHTRLHRAGWAAAGSLAADWAAAAMAVGDWVVEAGWGAVPGGKAAVTVAGSR